jgi:hypothetical protein
MTYEARFITDSDQVFGVEKFDAHHDDHAIAYAKRLFASGIGKGYQIWQGDRHVHTWTRHAR